MSSWREDNLFNKLKESSNNNDWKQFQDFLLKNNINHRELDNQYSTKDNFYIIADLPVTVNINLGYNLQEINLCCQFAFNILNKSIQKIDILGIGSFEVDDLEISKSNLTFIRNNEKIISLDINVI